jgi:hypothetical protein
MSRNCAPWVDSNKAAASAVDHQSGLRAADSKYEALPGGLGHRSELEERMAPSLGKVLLGRVIHADPAPSEDSDGWPRAWPKQRAEQPRAPVRLERAPKYSCRRAGRELDGLHRDATAVIGHGRLAGRPRFRTQPSSL